MLWLIYDYFMSIQFCPYLSGIKPETTGLVASHHVGKGGIPLMIMCWFLAILFVMDFDAVGPAVTFDVVIVVASATAYTYYSTKVAYLTTSSASTTDVVAVVAVVVAVLSIVVVSVVEVATLALLIGRRLVLLELRGIRGLFRILVGSLVRRLVGWWDLLGWKAKLLLKGICLLGLECLELSLELLNAGLHVSGVSGVGHFCLIMDLSRNISFRIFVLVGRLLLYQGYLL